MRTIARRAAVGLAAGSAGAAVLFATAVPASAAATPTVSQNACVRGGGTVVGVPALLPVACVGGQYDGALVIG